MAKSSTKKEETLMSISNSVTRLGDLLELRQLFKAFGKN